MLSKNLVFGISATTDLLIGFGLVFYGMSTDSMGLQIAGLAIALGGAGVIGLLLIRSGRPTQL